MVDAVGGVVERQAQEVIMADKILPHIEYVKGAIKLENNIIFIHDIDTFLSLEEEKRCLTRLARYKQGAQYDGPGQRPKGLALLYRITR